MSVYGYVNNYLRLLLLTNSFDTIFNYYMLHQKQTFHLFGANDA